MIVEPRVNQATAKEKTIESSAHITTNTQAAMTIAQRPSESKTSAMVFGHSNLLPRDTGNDGHKTVHR